MLGEVTVLVCAEEAAFDDYHVHSKREEDARQSSRTASRHTPDV
jgi:hypothetical protein